MRTGKLPLCQIAIYEFCSTCSALCVKLSGLLKSLFMNYSVYIPMETPQNERWLGNLAFSLLSMRWLEGVF